MSATDKKITKRQYNLRLAELEFKQEQLLAEWDAGNDRFDAYLEAGDRDAAMALGDWMNHLNTAEWETGQDIRHLHSEWSTRNWTSREWSEWDLVSQNID